MRILASLIHGSGVYSGRLLGLFMASPNLVDIFGFFLIFGNFFH